MHVSLRVEADRPPALLSRAPARPPARPLSLSLFAAAATTTTPSQPTPTT